MPKKVSEMTPEQRAAKRASAVKWRAANPWSARAAERHVGEVRGGVGTRVREEAARLLCRDAKMDVALLELTEGVREAVDGLLVDRGADGGGETVVAFEGRHAVINAKFENLIIN